MFEALIVQPDPPGQDISVFPLDMKLQTYQLPNLAFWKANGFSNTPSATRPDADHIAVGATVLVTTKVIAPTYLTLNQFELVVDVQTEKSNGIDDCREVYLLAKNMGPGATISGQLYIPNIPN